MSSRWLDRGLFISPIYYCLCTTEKQFHHELRHLKIKREDWPSFIKNDHSNATVHHLECVRDNKQINQCSIVCIQGTDKRKHVEVCGLLIHEAVHIWREICESIGERDPSSEFEAYVIQSIAQRLIHAYNTSKKKASRQEKPKKKAR